MAPAAAAASSSESAGTGRPRSARSARQQHQDRWPRSGWPGRPARPDRRQRRVSLPKPQQLAPELALERAAQVGALDLTSPASGSAPRSTRYDARMSLISIGKRIRRASPFGPPDEQRRLRRRLPPGRERRPQRAQRGRRDRIENEQQVDVGAAGHEVAARGRPVEHRRVPLAQTRCRPPRERDRPPDPPRRALRIALPRRRR